MPWLDNPYLDLSGGRWMKGNLHAHTTRSDGSHTPQQLVDAYAERGYGFLAVTDHDICATPDDFARLNHNGLILVCGNEITQGGPHMCHIGADRRLEPHWRRQQVINHACDGPGFIVMNHPNWQQDFNHISMVLLQQLTGYTGIEIFNGIMLAEEGSAYALDKWDMLLSSGRHVWGFANDDTHAPRYVGVGWNTAYVTPGAGREQPDASDVVAALRDGRFYASTGVVISKIEVDGLRVRIVTENAHRIVGVAQWGRRFATADDCTIEVEVPRDTPYARFECWGVGERFAWTQPMFIRQG
jgi:hypothetical protein